MAKSDSTEVTLSLRLGNGRQLYPACRPAAQAFLYLAWQSCGSKLFEQTYRVLPLYDRGIVRLSGEMGRVRTSPHSKMPRHRITQYFAKKTPKTANEMSFRPPGWACIVGRLVALNRSATVFWSASAACAVLLASSRLSLHLRMLALCS